MFKKLITIMTTMFFMATASAQITSATAVNGAVEISPTGKIQYTPNPDFHGTDTITYQIADGIGGFSEGTVTVTVAPINDQTKVENTTATINEDETLTVDLLATATDADSEDVLTVTSATANNGTITGATYAPNLNFNGTDEITYTVNDSEAATVFITIEPVNDAPEATAIPNQSAPTDALFTLQAATYFTDVDGDTLKYSLLNLDWATINEETGAITGTPLIANVGDHTATITAADAEFNATITASVSVSSAPTETVTRSELLTMIANGENVTQVDTSTITDMSLLFNGKSTFNQDISGWDVSNVRYMVGMFKGASTFNQDISGWDVGNIIWFNSMFEQANAFNQNLPNWNTSNATTMKYMFLGADNFNGLLTDWNTSKVTDMEYIFRYTNFNQDITKWDLRSVTNGDKFRENSPLECSNIPSSKFEFHSCLFLDQPATQSQFNTVVGNPSAYDLSELNTSQVTNMSNAFAYKATFNQDISGWDTSKVTSMNSVFKFTTAFNQDISGWDTSKVTDFSQMFASATAFNQDISGWNISQATKIGFMFYKANSFNQPIGNWERAGSTTANITEMHAIFRDNLAFNQDISNWNVGAVTVDWMFRGGNSVLDCSNTPALPQSATGCEPAAPEITRAELNTMITNGDDLSNINTSQITDFSNLFLNNATFNQDISKWDTGSATTMLGAFSGATAFNQDISGWDVSNVTTFFDAFYNASNFNSSVGLWNVGNTTDMSYMFMGATAFNQPLDNWNTSKVTNILGIFSGSPFNQPLNNWDTTQMTNMGYAFASTPFNQPLDNWNTSKVTSMKSIFSSAASFNQDISGWNVNAVTDSSNWRGSAGFSNLCTQIPVIWKDPACG